MGGIWSGSGGGSGLLTGYLVDIDEGSFGAAVGAGVDFEEDSDELETERGVSSGCLIFLIFLFFALSYILYVLFRGSTPWGGSFILRRGRTHEKRQQDEPQGPCVTGCHGDVT